MLGQAFADLIGMLLVRRLDLDAEEISSQVRQVLRGRAVIEQAKGLLAYQRHIPVADAYEELRRLAEHEGRTLSAAAADLLAAARRR